VFPKIQFIVTTHSPFVVQTARDGGLFVLRPTEKGTVEVEQFDESVRGWTATQILTSPRLFGLHSTRSVETEELIRESAALASKEQAGDLKPNEQRRLKEVRQVLDKLLSAPGETYDEMRRQEDMADYVDRTLNRLKNGKK
jgi:predicted ATP-binding protein involved in virulence